MSRIFLDLRKTEISLYSVSKNGAVGIATETILLSDAGGYQFSPGKEFRAPDECFLSLPLELLNFRILEFPFSDMKRIIDVLPFELDGIVLGGAENVVFNARLLGESKGKYEILVAYVTKDALRAILDGLRKSGFDPRFITSLELAHILNASPKEDIAECLLSPGPVTDHERLDRAEKEMKTPTLDFRKGEFLYSRDAERTKKSLKTTAALAVLLLLAFLFHSVITMVALERENTAMKDEIGKTYHGLFPNDKKVTDELYQLRAHLKELKDKESSFVGVSPLQILLGLSRTNMRDVSLNEITVDRDFIMVKGECAAVSDAERIKKNLEGFLTGVMISDTKTSLQNRILFTMTAKVKKT